MAGRHNHSTRPNFKRVHGDRYEYYEPAIRGCTECQNAANAKNKSLASAANDNFLRKNWLA